MKLDNNTYKRILTEASDYSMPEFFEWLKETPEFMELSDVEIEINFLFYNVAKVAHSFGYDGGLGF